MKGGENDLRKELLEKGVYKWSEAHEKSGKWLEHEVKRSRLWAMVSQLQMATLEGLCFTVHPVWEERFAKGDTYADADCDGFIDVAPHSPELWGNLGDEGREESVSSSMSECEEGGLVDFFFPKACLKELLSWKTNIEQDYFPRRSNLRAAHVSKS